MDYRGFIQRKVKYAFNKIGNLTTTVYFCKSTNSEFDFITGITQGIPIEVARKVFIEETENKDKNVLMKIILANTNEIPDLRLFDTIKINNVSWSIGNLITHNDYITKFEIFKEVS
jgi:hypothetical protein